MERIKIKRIYKCTRPKDVNQDEWNDCNICLFAKCGHSRCFEPNPKRKKQKGICIYEHCIENMEITEKPTIESCPVFGHNCPGGEKQAQYCSAQLKRTK